MIPRLVVCFLFLSAFAFAQSDFEAALARWTSSAAPGFSLQLERLSDPVLFQGQLVLIQVLHATPYPQRWDAPLPPPRVRYQFAGFLVDPPLEDCGSLAQPCLNSDLYMTNRHDALLHRDMQRRPLETDLNTYLPSLGVGSYRVAVVMRKLLPSGHYPDPLEYLISNAIEFRVEAASEEWVRETLQSAREILQPSLVWDSGSQQAARQIAAIDHPEARIAALQLFRFPHQREILLGLTQNTPAREACDLMRSRLAVPEQPLHLGYAVVMGETCAKAEHPFPEELSAAPSDRHARLDWPAYVMGWP